MKKSWTIGDLPAGYVPNPPSSLEYWGDKTHKDLICIHETGRIVLNLDELIENNHAGGKLYFIELKSGEKSKIVYIEDLLSLL